ncbi:MAG: cation diffusion facilitator family transporter [Bacilli bacterium]
MEKEEITKATFKTVSRITFGTLITNLCLAIGKLLGGIFGLSSALISDSINSFGDVFTSIISLFGNKLASKPIDKDHQYGHEKIENIAIVIFEMIVIFSISIMGYNAIYSLATGEYLTTRIPELIAIIVAGCCIFVKLVLFSITFISYKKNKSSMLQAASLDHILDSIGTSISLIGISIAYAFDIKWLDDAISIVITIMVIVGALKVLYKNVLLVTDECWDEEHTNAITRKVEDIEKVIAIDSLKTRMFGDRVYVDIEVQMDKNLTLEESHKVAEIIEISVEELYYEIIHVNVHVNPSL